MDGDDLFGERHLHVPSEPVAVLVPLPLSGTLSYLGDPALVPGDLVAVTVSGRETLGVIWDSSADAPATARLKPVLRKLDHPPLREPMRRFLERAARYTLSPPGMMLRMATRAPGLLEPTKMRTVYRVPAGAQPMTTPARQRVLDALAEGSSLGATELADVAAVSPGVIRAMRDGGMLDVIRIDADRTPPRLDPGYRRVTLNAEQQLAATAMRDAISAAQFSPFLLEGVTGSGKTETYLEAVAAALDAGRQSLVLLPEIALTADFIARMQKRFGAPPLEWHSGLTPAARRRVWRAVANGSARAVAGARSALFLPFRDLALTVVDEEHDQSYKQEDQVHYNARDLAVLRASIEKSTVVLASATPSLESWANAEAGKYRRLRLPHRHGKAVMPFLTTVDLRADPPERGKWISPVVADAAADAISRGEQALLFLNRRGYAPLTLCRKCGWRAGCAQCSAWLVEHRAIGALICHQCGHREPVPQICPECGDPEHLSACGPGVERIAEEAAARFPLARISALSSDLAGDPRLLQEQLRAVASGEADIIIGTQIVAKGHNFPNLTLSVVIDADLGLAGGDLRASERTFQLINQVAGRAGRAERPGRAMLQTSQPDHPVLRAILDGDGQRFRERLAAEREQARMPPFARLVAVIVQGESEEDVWTAARALAAKSAILTQGGIDVFGPAPAPYALLRGKYRVRMLLRMPKSVDHTGIVSEWHDSVALPRGVRAVLDVDPQSFL